MNKRVFISILPLLFLFLFMSCNNNDTDSENSGISSDLVSNPISADENHKKSKLPVMEFETTSHDFGIIVKGEKVANIYKFKNTGGADLIITDAKASCGCTVPKYSKKPIKPGEEGQIEVIFNSAGYSGSVHKSINVLTNAQPNTVRLEIEAEIFDQTKK